MIERTNKRAAVYRRPAHVGSRARDSPFSIVVSYRATGVRGLSQAKRQVTLRPTVFRRRQSAVELRAQAREGSDLARALLLVYYKSTTYKQQANTKILENLITSNEIKTTRERN